MTVAAAQNALTTVTTIQLEGRGLDTAATDLLQRLINASSEAAEGYCKRQFAFSQWTEAVPGARYATKLILRHTPVLSLVSILDDTSAVDLSACTILDSGQSGLVHRDSGWSSTPIVTIGAAAESLDNTAKHRYSATYVGGWVLPVDDGAPGSAAWQSNHTYAIGSFVAANSRYFKALTKGASGGTTPTWTASLGQLVTDGGVTWLDMDQAVRTLPADVEEACVLEVVRRWKRRGENMDVVSERDGDASMSYQKNEKLLPLCADAIALLNRYVLDF